MGIDFCAKKRYNLISCGSAARFIKSIEDRAAYSAAMGDNMITFLKISVLLLCAVVSIAVSCYSERKKGTCTLLAFFVGAGIMTFFSEEAMVLSLIVALAAFVVLSSTTVVLSRKTMHRKMLEREQKSV